MFVRMMILCLINGEVEVYQSGVHNCFEGTTSLFQGLIDEIQL